MNNNYSLARALYLREFPTAEARDFYQAWQDPNSTQLFRDLFAKHGLIDILGNKIEVGDTIAYSISKDRSALLFLYEVLEIKENGNLKAQAIKMPTRWYTPSKASTLLYPESRCMVVSKKQP